MHDPWQTLRQVLEAYREILGGALCGFYVHGSLAFGCFSWEKKRTWIFLSRCGSRPRRHKKRR